MKYLSIFLAMLFVGCASSDKSELDLLEEEVMAIHDEVMPKMGDLRKTQKQLMLLAQGESDSLQAVTYLNLADKIDIANESMMVWMRNYEPEFDGDDDQVRAYLTEQKEGIEKVKRDMISALMEGRSALPK